MDALVARQADARTPPGVRALAPQAGAVVEHHALAPVHVYGAALRSPAGARVRGPHGLARLPISRWAGPADAADACALAVARGPVLDVGCGPGRYLALLRESGVEALGIDPCPEAVELALRRGGHAVVRSIFAPLPGAGTYASALLLDGNVGIGGDPGALLRRVRDVLAPRGIVIAEVEGALRGARVDRLRLERPGAISAWFAWARVGADAIDGLAVDAGLRPLAQVTAGHRVFATLQRA